MNIDLNGNTLTNGYFSGIVVGESQGWLILSANYTAQAGDRIQADTSGGTFTVTLPGADQVRTYGLDGLGNWRNSNFTLVGSGGTTTSTAEVRQHNYVNEITSVKDTTGGTPVTTAFAYDHGNNTDGVQGNGNLVNDGVRLYQWDVFNRLIQVSKASDSTVLATYVYDSLGRRIQKTIANLSGGNGGLTGDIPAGTFDYLYDGQQVIEQRNHASPTAWTQVYFWGQYIDELLFFSVPTSTTYRVLSDLLYRSVAIVTTSNVITEAYDTDAYGNTLCYSGAGTDTHWFTNDDVRTNNPINGTIFTGRLYDPESQIYYYRARYYSPQIGRFISRDPLKKAGLRQGPNLYWYVQCAPVMRIDPKGLQSILGALSGAVAGAAVALGNAIANNPITGSLGALENLNPALGGLSGDVDNNAWFERHYPNAIALQKEYFKNTLTRRLNQLCDPSKPYPKLGSSEGHNTINPDRRRTGISVDKGSGTAEGDIGQSPYFSDIQLGSFTFLLNNDTPDSMTWSKNSDGSYNYSWKATMIVQDHLGLDSDDMLSKGLSAVGSIADVIGMLQGLPTLGAEAWPQAIAPWRTIIRAKWPIEGNGKCCPNA